ncbi:uncharacterized protein LOC127474573 [Manacus candei]|nr:uncharacterized protein LOC127474573 [Manacus candei]
MKLPKGYFLLCGDRAWPGIRAYPEGGPCTVGKLALFNPVKFHLENQLVLSKDRVKRSLSFAMGAPLRFPGSKPAVPKPPLEPKITPQPIRLQNSLPAPHLNIGKPQYWPTPLPFPEDCDSNIHIWSRVKNFWASFPVPRIGTAHALSLLTHLGCWLTKEANATTWAIEGLLEDTQKLKEVSLQNRAAIDFLLLAHGHGCQEFEGMCCMNFSDHSESIHQSINQLKSLVGEIHRDKEGSLDSLFDWIQLPNLPSWSKKLIMLCILSLFGLISLCTILPCLVLRLRKLLLNSIQANTAALQQNKEGGDVGRNEDEWQRYEA